MVRGSGDLPSCAASQQQSGEKYRQGTGNDQRQRELEERSHGNGKLRNE
jgi:hypothetical protein